VHKSQGLNISEGTVFNFDHEPTWNPCRTVGVPFVGMSRTPGFNVQAFKYVPDYWEFQKVANEDLFKWRQKLEERLDVLHDETAERMFPGSSGLEGDIARHVAWTESKTGEPLSDAALEDVRLMLSVRGMLPIPAYDDKPSKAAAPKAGGGKRHHGPMRASTSSKPKWEPADIAHHHESLRERAQAPGRKRGPPTSDESSDDSSASDHSGPDTVGDHSHSLPLSARNEGSHRLGLGKAVPKPSWFNSALSGCVRNGVQVGLTCGYFAVRHAVHPADIGTLADFERRAQEDRLRYPFGDYDVKALLENCNRAGFEMHPLSGEDLLEATRLHQIPDSGREELHLFMAAHDDATACILHKPRHWFCIKKDSDHTLLLCDSLDRHPYAVSPEELAGFLATLLVHQANASLALAGEWSAYKVLRS
jgi:hypothetical protein